MASTQYRTDVSIGGVARVSDGSAATPALSFSADTNTGIYRSTTDTLNISTGGTSRFALSTSALTTTLPLRGQAGTAGAPALSFSGDTNSGIYSVGADQVGVSTGGTVRLTIASALITVNGLRIAGVADPASDQDVATKAYVDSATGSVDFPILAPEGEATAPSYSFADDDSVGLYMIGSTLSVAAGGDDALMVNSAAVSPMVPVQAPNGSVSAPSYSFSTHPTTGLYASALGLHVAHAGNPSVSFDSNGVLSVNGSAGTPAFSFSDDGDTGIYRSGSDRVAISTGGVERLGIGASTIDVNSMRVTGVSTPTESNDATNKDYVDTGFIRAIQQVTDTSQTGPVQNGVFITSTIGSYVFSSSRWYRATVQVVGASQLAGTGWNFTLRTSGGTLLTGTTTYVHRPTHTTSETLLMVFYFIGGNSAHGIRCQWNQRDGNNSTFTSYGNNIATTMMVEGPL